MTNGPWRIAVDCWITTDADWYGHREWVVGGDCPDLRSALHRVADHPFFAELIDEDRLTLRNGRAPRVDLIPPVPGDPVQPACGDHPAPCNCDDPAAHR